MGLLVATIVVTVGIVGAIVVYFLIKLALIEHGIETVERYYVFLQNFQEREGLSDAEKTTAFALFARLEALIKTRYKFNNAVLTKMEALVYPSETDKKLNGLSATQTTLLNELIEIDNLIKGEVGYV